MLNLKNKLQNLITEWDNEAQSLQHTSHISEESFQEFREGSELEKRVKVLKALLDDMYPHEIKPLEDSECK